MFFHRFIFPLSHNSPYLVNLSQVWINTYENTIFRGLFTSINPSYFDVNYRGTIGFDTLPYPIKSPGKHCCLIFQIESSAPFWAAGWGSEAQEQNLDVQVVTGFDICWFTTFLGYLALGDSSKVDVFVRMHRVLVLLGVWEFAFTFLICETIRAFVLHQDCMETVSCIQAQKTMCRPWPSLCQWQLG